MKKSDGRKKSEGEKFSVHLSVYLTPSEFEKLEKERKKVSGDFPIPKTFFIRQILKECGFI